eukprot:CAMPEP_0206584968 /NCGR_PEP_ID=MMETSP0325_2-20121206/36110_1 /ASSEMBLY_ACC=CAM_ASM_000347 /TAXON_ID=2866 /ORGANISM="Crypthecodinium cohnii, Strain Seligo" /LENGTH=438 /DNA_ID=CAMNT_0054092371 /DNA_START=27 /DNA_END=1339 /DNA_ORIENTATION=-
MSTLRRLSLLATLFPIVSGEEGSCSSYHCAVEQDASAEASLELLQIGSASAASNQNRAKAKSSQDGPTAIKGGLTLDHFRKKPLGAEASSTPTCYDRSKHNQWAVVDSHLHVRPFGGEPVPYTELMRWLRDSGILFANAYGIGQRLPVDSNCTYYLDCPGTPVIPSIKNDMYNGQESLDYETHLSKNEKEAALMASVGPVMTMSMSFPDLHEPEGVKKRMKLLEEEFPGKFRWMGELNVAKQALFNNSQGQPVPLETIEEWAPFMEELRAQKMPVAFHSDLGNDAEPFKYLPQMDKILDTYPDNTVIWVHLGGLSKQLDPLAPVLLEKPLYASEHIDMLKQRLRDHPNFMLDLAWDVLYDEVWSDPAKLPLYRDFINEFPTRFLPGTDFVAASTKPEKEYQSELNKTSAIYKEISDEAFRNIALGENYFQLLDMEYTA